MPLKKVFLCHSSSDKLFVDRLASDLEKVNIGVWYDKWEIKVGDSLIEKIQEGLENNDYLAIILSPESVASEWVKKELNSALMKEIKEKKIVVLPCLICNCSIPTFLSEKKYADFRNSYEDGFTALLLAIFPESKEVAIRSRDFRVIQYLISGLTNTDLAGSNILNAQQYIKIYHFRKELKNYLGLDEKKLLFYSAVAFKSANPDTPFFINNNVPVWGLVDEVDDLIRSQWLIEGTNQKIFGNMVRYFEWALTTNENITMHEIINSLVNARKALDYNHYNTVTNDQTKFYIFKLLAKCCSDYFIEDCINKDNIGVTSGLIEASAELPKPLAIDYYLDIYQKESNISIKASIIKALAKNKQPIAVHLLSEHYEKLTKSKWTNDIMNMFNDSIFILELRKWLGKCSELDDQIDIIGALGNCGDDISEDISALINKHHSMRIMNNHLIRIIGCYGGQSHADFLLSKVSTNKSNISDEAIIYAVERLMKKNALELLKNWYKETQSNLIKATTIETIAKYDTAFINCEIANYQKHYENTYLLSAFVRAVEISRSPMWKEFLLSLYKHPSMLVKLCAARSGTVLADQDYCLEILDGDYDNIVKTVFDEFLYCRTPFLPDWLSSPHKFDQDLARMPVRLTWPDQPIVYFQDQLDVAKVLDEFMQEQKY